MQSKLFQKLGYGYDQCLTGDTLIPLLDGTEIALCDLVGQPCFWVYSLNPDGKLRPGRGTNAHLTIKDAPLVAVTLDNGLVIRCTPWHPFLLRNGEYRNADHLIVGESLMPLYRRLEPVVEGGNDYEAVYQPFGDKWVFTHRFVEARCPKGYVRHHKDFNRFNNHPDNLEVMLWEKHQQLHKEAGIPVTDKGRAARRRNMLAINAKRKGVALTPKQILQLSSARENIDFEKVKAAGCRTLTAYNQSPVGRSRSGKRQSQQWSKLWDTDEFSEAARSRMSATATRLWASPSYRAERSEETARANHKRWHTDRSMVNPDCGYCTGVLATVANHKVVSVVPDGTADVYDFTVEKYHNFALSAGVFVHNSGEVADAAQQNIEDTSEPEDHHETEHNAVNLSSDAQAEKDFPGLGRHQIKFPARTD